MWLLLLGAMSAQAAPGGLSLVASEEARVVVFPRVDAQRIDVGVYDNRVSLDEQLRGLSARYLQQAWATSIGGGTWFLTLHVDEGIGLEWSQEGAKLRFVLGPSDTPVQTRPDAYTLEQLLAAPPPRRPATPPTLTLHPLQGDAYTLQMQPIDAFRGMPEVVTPQLPVYAPSLAAVDIYRAAFTDPALSARDQAAALARAGVAYTDLELYREATHYLRRAVEAGRNDAPTALALAKAEVARGHAPEARSACRYAARQGAQDEDVLACYVGVSYIDPDLPASELARALASSSRSPHRQLMAAQRLQADHRHAEALVLLERIAEGGSTRALASLGDARQATGDLPGAVEAWRAASVDGWLRPALKIRLRMAEWIDKGPADFGGAIPELLQLSDLGGAGGAEAHYLLAQIAEVYGDPDLAAEQLNLLWAFHPEEALQSDVPERLVQTCEFRLRQLEDQQRHVDLVAFFDLCWRDELDGMVVKPRSLTVASHSLAALGLSDEALQVQLRAVAMSTRVGRSDPEQLAWLAELYVRTDRAKEALETLAYARKQGKPPPELAERLALTEGDARFALGDEAKALAAWGRVDTPASRRRRGVLRARQGACGPALALLEGLDDPASSLAAARCLLKAGRTQEAADRVAGLADSDDEQARADGGWLSSVAAWGGAIAAPLEPDPEDGEAEPQQEGFDLWKRLLEEEQASAIWAEERDLDL